MSDGATRRLWRIAGPIILSNVSVPMLGAVDTAVIGHLPDPAYLGGVAIGAMIFNFLYWGFGFLRMGTTGFVAQAAGAGDAAELRAILGRALLLAIAIALVLIVAQGAIGQAALTLTDASPAVESSAATFFAVRIWSAPATLANYVLLGWLLGTQRAKAALVLQLVMNGVNVVLDLWFVIGLGWGVPGVAAATAIAEYVAAALGLWLILRTLPDGRWEMPRILDRARILALLRVNRDIFLRTLCLIFAFAWFTQAGARLGDVTLAANAVLLNFQSIMAFALDGFAFAAEALVGGAVGARDRRAFVEAVRAAALFSLVFAVLFTAVYAGLGHWMIDRLTDLVTVRQAAYRYLPWLIVSPLISVWSFLLDGIYIGATRTVEMRNGMIIALVAYLAAAALLVPQWGNHGLWLAFTVLMVARAVPLAAWYPRLLRTFPPPGVSSRM
jgi:multidrug resistance protein, MATE family